MAGRPRTMAKRVARLFERNGTVADELLQLIPDQYRPAKGEAWTNDTGDLFCTLWRMAYIEVACAHMNLEDLSECLNAKVEVSEKRNVADQDELDDEDDDHGRARSLRRGPSDC
jgi:hypothetical protein